MAFFSFLNTGSSLLICKAFSSSFDIRTKSPLLLRSSSMYPSLTNCSTLSMRTQTFFPISILLCPRLNILLKFNSFFKAVKFTTVVLLVLPLAKHIQRYFKRTSQFFFNIIPKLRIALEYLRQTTAPVLLVLAVHLDLPSLKPQASAIVATVVLSFVPFLAGQPLMLPLYVLQPNS